MQSLRRRQLPYPSSPLSRSFIAAKVKWVRDRALDHAVEKEKYLLPFISLKDHFFSHSPSPPHSLPLSAITPLKSSLSLPFRPIRFIRLFPSAFHESFVGSSQPILQISPSKELISLHEEEIDAVQICKDEVAERLLKLLMLTPERKLPLWVIEKLRWDLGLPKDFAKTILPNYPDYFCISQSDPRQLDLELVCYRKDIAISAMERSAQSRGDYKKGSSLAFPLNFSRGFELEKRIRKWLDEFQTLPYMSPYESGAHLPPRSDITEKWVVGVLHEILNLFVGKKTEKNNLVLLAEKLKLPPGFRKAIVNHPGIFYVSNKLRTQTVVLREGYKRNLLVEKHPLMGMRYRYVHLMHLGKPAGAKKGEGKKGKDERESHESENEGSESEFEDFEDEEEEEESSEEEEEEESDEEDFNFKSRRGERRIKSAR